MAAGDVEGDAVPGAEADGGVDGEVEGLAGRRGEAPVAGDDGEDESAFHPGEAFGDALAAAAGEGEVGVAGAS